MKKTSLHLPATVYRITNLVNGKFYIGVTTKPLTLRLAQHFSAATTKALNGAFQKAIRKYGREAFAIEPLMLCETAEDALAHEIRLISEMAPQYNSTKGGDGQLGRVFSAEALKRIGDAHRGKPSPMRGRKMPETAKAKLRQLGTERKDLFSKFSGLGPAALARAVIRLNDGARFESASEAAREIGASKSTVIEVCNRNPRRATVKGMVFRYVDDVFDVQAELDTAFSRTKRKYKSAGGV